MEQRKEETARQFGRMSQAYADSPGHAKGEDLRRVVELVAPQPHDVILDVATGAGHTAGALASLAGCVYAVDLTHEMIQRTRELSGARSLANLHATVGDSEHLPFADRSFDAVTSRIAPHHFHDIRAAVREMARVLKPGGRLVIEDNSSPADPALDEFLNRIEKMRDPTHIRAWNEAEWREMVAAAGLKMRSMENFRKSQNVATWLERAGMTESAKQAFYEVLAAASPAAQEHFGISYIEDKAVTFTDDKVILTAVK